MHGAIRSLVLLLTVLSAVSLWAEEPVVRFSDAENPYESSDSSNDSQFSEYLDDGNGSSPEFELAQAQANQPPALAPQANQPLQNQPSFQPRRSTRFRRRNRSVYRLARVPNMFGDTKVGGGGLFGFAYSAIPSFTAFAGNPGQVLAVVNHPTFNFRRTKIAENNSPVPRDRVFMTYQHFHNATDLTLRSADFTSRSLSIDQVTLGVEKTFYDGRFSTEFRLPITTQLTNSPQLTLLDPLTPQISDDRSTSVGNISGIFKAVLHEEPNRLFSGGLIVQLPTAPDVTIRDFEVDTGRGLQARLPEVLNNRYEYRNDSVILSPFLGLVTTPSRRWFTQSFVSVEFDVSGSEVEFVPTVNGVLDPNRQRTVDLRQQVLLRVDVGGGYWLYQNPCGRHITGVAMIGEIHWTSTLNDAQVRQLPSRDPTDPIPVTFGNLFNRQDIVNLTLGPVFQLGERSTLAIGSVIPLSSGEDKFFDYELSIQLNLWFGE